MRVFNNLFIVFMVFNCSSTKLTDSWRNPDYNTFKPKNILVIGVVQDLEARKVFEFQLKNELNKRRVNALQSTVVFEESFQDSQQTEIEIDAQVNKLLKAGYDSVLVSLVKGIGKNDSYSGKCSRKWKNLLFKQLP
ncbi:hypothetical protein [uncultured Winogradskyella sp.]|uniref:hypothetical protein n=1 Tax=uncultured Winogradskyella sp. TaxID=395353 RepID=UPI0030D7B300